MATDTPKMNVEIPGVDVGAIAREVIAVKVAEGLLGHPDAIRQIVIKALETKVDSNGTVGRGYGHDLSYVEYVAQDLVRAATKKVLAEKVEAMRPELEKALEVALRASIKPAAKMLAERFVSDAKSGSQFVVDVRFQDRR